MAQLVPSYTDNVSVLASQDLARNARVRGTLDLAGKHGAWLFLRIGRGGTTALGTSIKGWFRRMVGGVTVRHPVSSQLESQTAAAASTTVGTDSAAEQNTLTAASGTGFAAGDLVLVGAGTAREEWCRVSRVNGAALEMDAPLLFTHTAAQADTIRNKADIFAPIWIEGGAVYEIGFDYGEAATGDTARVEALAQRLDSITSA